MKLLRIGARTILLIIMISFAFFFGRDACATDVKIIRGHLLVDRAPFIIKGVNYNPIPSGLTLKPHLPSAIISLRTTAPSMSVTFLY